MTTQQTNESLSNDMWRACDILRRDNNVGGIIQYTEHLAWLLFLKFLDEEEKKRVDIALVGGEPYTPVLRGELAWDNWAGPEKVQAWGADELIQFVRGRLLPGLARLNGSPLANTIGGIFSDEHVGDQTVVRNLPVCASGYNLKDVLTIINSIRFESDDEIFTITQFYEDLLWRMGQENQIAGEFQTPRPVIRFMIDVIDPQIGEELYDPACGTCGYLAESFLHMVPKAQTIEDHERLQQKTFYGQEKKGITYLLGIMNMVLHGVASPNVTRANTLEESVKGTVKGRRDVIMTNPPFGGTEGRHIQQNFPVQANATELLFMQHIIKKLKRTPNARCAMVVPEGTLFRGGAFAQVKKDLLEQFHLFAVVSLPPGTFAPYSDVKTALLFFKRPDEVMQSNPTARDEIWYYELPLPEDLKRFSKGTPIEDEHFDDARQQWQQWQAYLAGKKERPFAYAADIRASWQAYWANREGGARPEPPYTSWVERLEDFKAQDYDLSARNPNQDERVQLPLPTEITASLLERTREFQGILLNVHEMLINGDEA